MADRTEGVETLAANGDICTQVYVKKGPFNLHVMCADADEWEAYCSYDGGATEALVFSYVGPKKLTPTEGDEMLANGVLWWVKATAINTGPFRVRIGQ